MAEFDSVIPAGSSGTLTAKVKTASTQKGRISKSISVVTDSPEARELRLRFTADISTPVTARPAFRFMITTTEGKPGRSVILLSRDDDADLEVRSSEPDRDGLALVAEAVTDPSAGGSGADHRAGRGVVAAKGDVWIELLAAPSLPSGRYTGSVLLTTNHPEMPTLEIPYTVRVRPLIEVRPDVLRLWSSAARGDPGRSTALTIRHNGGEKFRITGVEVSDPKLIIVQPAPETATVQQTLRVRLADDLDEEGLAASVQAWIRITTDDPQRPNLEVPVVIAPTRLLSRRPVRQPERGPER